MCGDEPRLLACPNARCVAPPSVLWREHWEIPCGLASTTPLHLVVPTPQARQRSGARGLPLTLPESWNRKVSWAGDAAYAWKEWLSDRTERLKIGGKPMHLALDARPSATARPHDTRLALLAFIKYSVRFPASEPFFELVVSSNSGRAVYNVSGPVIPFAAMCIPLDARLEQAAQLDLWLAMRWPPGKSHAKSFGGRSGELGLFRDLTSPFAPRLVPACECESGDASVRSDCADASLRQRGDSARSARDPASRRFEPERAVGCPGGNTPMVLDEAYDGRVRVTSRSPYELPELQGLYEYSGGDPNYAYTFRIFNPIFHRGGLLLRLSNAQECTVERPGVENKASEPLHASVIAQADLSFKHIRILPELNLHAVRNGTCSYIGVEDVRSLGDAGELLLGSTMVQMKPDGTHESSCVATQVVLSTKQRSITAVPSPSGLSMMAEKNWVGFAEGNMAVQMLLDAHLRTHLVSCQHSGCAYARHVQWRLRACAPCLRRNGSTTDPSPSACAVEERERLPRLRSGTNWVRISHDVTVAVAHEARQITDEYHAGWEYASRLLKWDRGAGRLTIYRRTMFSRWTRINVAAAHKGRVEFATGLRLAPDDRGGSRALLVAYGVADCYARVARIDLSVLSELRVDFELEEVRSEGRRTDGGERAVRHLAERRFTSSWLKVERKQE